MAPQEPAGGTPAGDVVVGVSDSLAGLAALRRGILEARRTRRTLVAVRAWEPPEGDALYRRWPEPSWSRLWADEARQRLDRAFELAAGGAPADLRIVRRVVRGPAGPVLCSIAASPDDLLVIGVARPRGPAARLHRRPVHRHVPARARCEVLVVAGPRLLPREARILRRGERMRRRGRARGLVS
ncbi:universal stress protein family protein [Streptomyces puniciscabiei]|uniref:Universal stress protein family protein n=1 Tax=Streptomyces puniciscabiei TaxID=164348 RepID=A0A542SZU9_9ACTN|nr:universal stress protein [Streptomyces puniciscabiei]TQK79837.1 universal stress protein family protein [Streptomyces puniciscabiei]